MKKKLICKILAFSLFCTSIPALATNCIVANAAVKQNTSIEASANNSEKQIILTLNTYLNAFKEFDMDTIINTSNDVRTQNESDYRSELEGFKANPNTNLQSFKINTNIENIDKNNAIIKAEVELKNGYTYNQSFKLSLINGNWKVIIFS